MKLKYLVAAIAIALSTLTISGCQSGPGYDNRPIDGGSSYGSGGGNSGY